MVEVGQYICTYVQTTDYKGASALHIEGAAGKQNTASSRIRFPWIE